jgi:hypothetical protein
MSPLLLKRKGEKKRGDIKSAYEKREGKQGDMETSYKEKREEKGHENMKTWKVFMKKRGVIVRSGGDKETW